MSAFAPLEPPAIAHQVIIQLPLTNPKIRKTIGYFAQKELAARVTHFVRELLDERIETKAEVLCNPIRVESEEKQNIETKFCSKLLQDKVNGFVEQVNRTMSQSWGSEETWGNMKFRVHS